MSRETEIIKKQCQYCRFVHLNKCTYDTKTWWLTDDCLVFAGEIKRVQGYFESVIIPARIAEAKRETLEKIADTQEEIDNMVAKAVAEERAKLISKINEQFEKHCHLDCKFEGRFCTFLSLPRCRWWQSIKEVKQ